MLRKVISILLLTVFLHDNICFLVLFKVMQIRVKHEIKREIESNIPFSELILIEINSQNIEELNWLKFGKEFRLNGNFYDIVKTEYSGTKTKFFCINDKKERDLFKNLDSMILKQIMNHFNSNNILQKLINKTSSQYLSQIINIIIPKTILFHTIISSIKYTSFLREIPSPPPKLF
jgi:hypothetical protein